MSEIGVRIASHGWLWKVFHSWWCEPCSVEVYHRRCPHCGKLKGDKK